MKTKHLTLRTDQIETCSFWVGWHDNGQMWWYIEKKDGRWHGAIKWWYSNGGLQRHTIYENGKWVKTIV